MSHLFMPHYLPTLHSVTRSTWTVGVFGSTVENSCFILANTGEWNKGKMMNWFK